MKRNTEVYFSDNGNEPLSDEAFFKVRKLSQLKMRSRRMIYAAVALLFSFGLVALCLNVFLKIQKITVSGGSIYDDWRLIEMSGITEGQNIYSIDKDKVEKTIVSNFPYIKSVKVVRHLPTDVELIVEEDVPRYYFELCGEYYVLSDSLRILELSENENKILSKYEFVQKLVLSSVTRAVVGEQVGFENDTYYDYVYEVLTQFLNCSITDRINTINLSDKFNIYIIYDNRFKVQIGNMDNLNLKISVATAVIETISANYKGTINVENDTAFFIMDNKIDLS